MKILILSFALLSGFMAHASDSPLISEIRAKCFAGNERDDVTQDKIATKLDCLYGMAIDMAGGPTTPLMSPNFRQVMMQFRSNYLEASQTPSINTNERVLLRALREFTMPSHLPPLDDPARMTLAQFRIAHARVFMTMPFTAY